MKKLFPLASIAVIIALAISCDTESVPEKDGDPVIAEAVSAVSVDSLRSYIDDLVGFHTRHTLSSQTDPEKGIGAAVNYLAERCEKWAASSSGKRPRPVVEKIRYTVGQNGGRYDRVTTVPELMVTLPGTEGSREIILMAHIDTRVIDVMDSTAFAPGADDDGSGLACLLETVRILSKVPLNQTIKCLFVSGEEQGLDGSHHFATKAKAEGWPIQAVLSNDMIGNSRASGTLLHEDHKVRVFSENIAGGEDTPSRQLARYVKEMASIYVPEQEVVLNYRSDRYRRGGDQQYFQREGFTAIRVCEYCEDYERTHQDVRTKDGVDYGDLASYVDFPYLARNIQVNLAAVMNLAMSPATPTGVRIANSGDLDNNTILSWNPITDESGQIDKSVKYQILCRETSSSQWMNEFPMGLDDIVLPEPNESGKIVFSCPLSKDNYYFAVRAVSDGHPGLPAVAR